MMISTPAIEQKSKQFLKDTLDGLSAEPKYLQSKYFYDQKGDFIFQQIMDTDEYYLSRAELEIIKNNAREISSVILAQVQKFDLVELGCGDLTKSVHLLKTLLSARADFRFFPIDISKNVIERLDDRLGKKFPELNYRGLNGDYLEMLSGLCSISNRKKVVLFMGANIGNMDISAAEEFCCQLRALLSPGDLLIIGFDLKKNPQTILDAYNDSMGITSSFNLNLLDRINRELGGDFEVQNFQHYANYDPESGACKSYLVSLKDQKVNIAGKQILFSNREHVFTEISQKYTLGQIDKMAKSTGFQLLQNFLDSQSYFVNTIWVQK